MEKINVVVIGCGRIGKMHIHNIIADFPQVQINALVDNQVDPSWAKRLGILNVYPIDALHTVLDDSSLDAVVIAAPSSTHVDLIKQAASAGKHIFCEKPIGFTVQAIQTAIDVVEDAGVLLQVGLNRRFDPDFMHVKKQVMAGAIGDPHIVRITNRDPKRPDLNFIPRSGGLFLDFNVHDFDMARFITGQEVKNVFAMGAVLVDPQIGELNDIDTAVITLKMMDDTLCIIDSSREAVYGYDQRLEVFGSKGEVRARNLTETRTQLSTAAGVLSEKPLYSFVERYREAYRNELKAFIDCLQNKTQPLAKALDVQKAVAVAAAANASLKTNRPVSLETNMTIEEMV